MAEPPGEERKLDDELPPASDNGARALEADANERAEKRKAEATVLKDQGNQAFNKGDYTRAVKLYTQGLERLKDFAVLYTNRAQAYNKLGKFTEAMEDCRTAMQLELNNVKALVHLGKAQHGLKDYEAAVTTYKEITKIDKKHEKMVADNVMKALDADANQCTEKRKAEATVLKDQGNQAFVKSDYTRAIELYTQGLERLKDFVVYTNRAQAYNKLGKFTEAMEDCRTALQLEPNNVKALLHLGKAQQGLKDYVAAVTTYKEITKIDKKHEKMVADYIAAVNLAESTAKSDMEAERLFSEGDVKATGVHEMGLSDVTDSQAALTQQLPDDQQTTQSGSGQPSQQEPMQQPPPQLQPRPAITKLQGPVTFEDFQREIIDNYKQTATTIPAHPTLQSRTTLPERNTELYAEFAVALFKLHNKDMRDDQVMPTMMSIIDDLGRVALQGLLDSRGERLMFNETEFQNCQSSLAEGCRVGFLQRETFTCGLDVKVLVTFPHKSIQEYFAACHLVILLEDDENNFRHQLEQINVHAMEYLLRFCCGTSRQAAGLILDHIKKMPDDKVLDYEKKVQRLARLLLLESGSGELAAKLVRPTQVKCESNEDLKPLNYYLQHVTPPLKHTDFDMKVRKQELTFLKGILLSDSIKSACKVNVNYHLSEQEEEGQELSLLEETLGVVDEQHRARLDVAIHIERESWFDMGRVSHSFFRMQEQTGSLSLFMVQRSPDEVVDLLNVLEGCRLRRLVVGDTNLHARIRDVSHIPSSLDSLNLSLCGLVDNDVKDLMRILPAGHGLRILVLDYNAFSSNAVSALTDHLRSLPNVGWLPLADERGGVRQSRGLTTSIGGPLSWGTRPFMY